MASPCASCMSLSISSFGMEENKRYVLIIKNPLASSRVNSSTRLTAYYLVKRESRSSCIVSSVMFDSSIKRSVVNTSSTCDTTKLSAFHIWLSYTHETHFADGSSNKAGQDIAEINKCITKCSVQLFNLVLFSLCRLLLEDGVLGLLLASLTAALSDSAKKRIVFPKRVHHSPSVCPSTAPYAGNKGQAYGIALELYLFLRIKAYSLAKVCPSQVQLELRLARPQLQRTRPDKRESARMACWDWRYVRSLCWKGLS